MKLAFTVQYEGTNYSGFQKQSNAITVQDCLLNAFNEIIDHPIDMNISGRTDKGVHALGQVFDINTDIHRKKEQWINGLNASLPNNISIVDVIEVPNNFHARFDAIERQYCHVLFLGNEKPIIQKNFVSWIKRDIDIEKLKLQTKFLLGKHDFSAFRSSRCNSKNPIREIKSIEIKQHKKMVFITITANAFLQNMVRIIVGTLIDIAKNEISISLKEIMNSKNRRFAGKTMTPSGLFYLGPKYPKIPKINTPKQIQYII